VKSEEIPDSGSLHGLGDKKKQLAKGRREGTGGGVMVIN